MARAFVAVVPPEAVLDAVAGAAAALHGRVEGARWTRRDQWHLTLQFLGNRADLDAVSGALGGLAVPAGGARLGGAGAFPSERRGRVLWLGLAEGGPLLVQLAAAVGARLAPLGHEPESRPYHAHLTLARLARPGDLRPAVAALGAGPVGPAWRVAEVVLFESRLHRAGAEYVARAAFPLAGP